MKIIDRYLFKTFLVPLAYCLAAFTLIFIVFDLFDHMNNFMDARTPLPQVVWFYALLIPSVLIYIVPISLLLAVLYSLAQLTKNSELTAMRACGISLSRIMAPFILTGLFATGLVTFFNETIGPRSAYATQLFLRAQKIENKDAVYLARQLPYKSERYRRAWFIGSFDTRTYAMTNIKVNQFRENGLDEKEISAESAQWLDGRWWFRRTAIQDYDEWGNPRGAPRRVEEMEMTDLREKPRDFLREVKLTEVKAPQYLAARDLLRYIRTHPLGPETVARYMTDVHTRLAMPWTCFIVVLLGIPFGNHTGRKGAMMGALLSLSLFFAVYVLIHTGTWLGKEGYVAPWMAGWLPTGLWLVTGSVLTLRMR